MIDQARFSRIETYSNWSHIDRFEGQDIPESGIRVLVRWPDGYIDENTLRVEHGSFEYGDMDPNHKAYLDIEHHGVKNRLYLRKSLIELARAS